MKKEYFPNEILKKLLKSQNCSRNWYYFYKIQKNKEQKSNIKNTGNSYVLFL